MNFMELTERLARFFAHYMPVGGAAVYLGYDRKIVKLSEYLFDDVLKTPDQVILEPEVWEHVFCAPSCSGNVYDVQVQSSRGFYAEIFRRFSDEPITSLVIPLKYNKGRAMYFAIHAYGESCYAPEHVNLCRKLQPALVFAMGNMESRQHFDLLDSASLDQLARTVREDERPYTENDANSPAFLTLDEYVVAYIEKALRHTKGRVAGKNGAAALLGVHVSTLWSKIRKFHINVPRD